MANDLKFYLAEEKIIWKINWIRNQRWVWGRALKICLLANWSLWFGNMQQMRDSISVDDWPAWPFCVTAVRTTSGYQSSRGHYYSLGFCLIPFGSKISAAKLSFSKLGRLVKKMSYMHTHWRDVDVGNIFAKDSLKYFYGIKKLLFCILASE